MPNFPQSQQKALAQIKANGQLLSFRTVDVPLYDIPSGHTLTIDEGPATNVETFTAWAVVLPFNKSKTDFDDAIVEETIGKHSRAMLIAAEPDQSRPEPGTTVTYEDSDDWVILGVIPLTFQGTDVLYKAVMVR